MVRKSFANKQGTQSLEYNLINNDEERANSEETPIFAGSRSIESQLSDTEILTDIVEKHKIAVGKSKKFILFWLIALFCCNLSFNILKWMFIEKESKYDPSRYAKSWIISTDKFNDANSLCAAGDSKVFPDKCEWKAIECSHDTPTDLPLFVAERIDDVSHCNKSFDHTECDSDLNWNRIPQIVTIVNATIYRELNGKYRNTAKACWDGLPYFVNDHMKLHFDIYDQQWQISYFNTKQILFARCNTNDNKNIFSCKEGKWQINKPHDPDCEVKFDDDSNMKIEEIADISAWFNASSHSHYAEVSVWPVDDYVDGICTEVHGKGTDMTIPIGVCQSVLNDDIANAFLPEIPELDENMYWKMETNDCQEFIAEIFTNHECEREALYRQLIAVNNKALPQFNGKKTNVCFKSSKCQLLGKRL